MASLQNAVKIGDEEVPINPMTLFSHLMENDIISYLLIGFVHLFDHYYQEL